MRTSKGNVMKKVASVAVSAAMVGTTLMGASAADLRDLPAPFISDGVADVLFVVGSNAKAEDTIGAVDIAIAFQATAVTEQEIVIPGSTTDYTVSDGLEVEQSGDALNYNETFDLGTNLEFDKNDFPELLADGSIADQDENEDWEYDQEIQFVTGNTNPSVKFGIPDNDVFGDLPQLYVDFGNDDPAYRIFVDFDETSTLGAATSSATDGLQDSETMEILGKIFTFDPSNDGGDSTYTLFGSDVVTFLELNVPQTITVDGQTIEAEVIGGNSDSGNNEVILSINGQPETVQEGQSRTIGGIEVFVQDVFIRNIPTLDASATIFIGSDEFKMDQSSSFDSVELNGQDLEGVFSALNSNSSTTAKINQTTDLAFEFRPGDIGDEEQYLLVGETVTDPMFEIDVTFAGPRPALNDDERSYSEFERNSDEYSLTVTNRDGDTYEDVPILEETDSDNIRYAQDGSGAGNAKRLILDPTEFNAQGALAEDDFFFTFEGSTTNAISKVFYVKDFKQENNINYTIFVDMSDDSEYKLEVGDTLASTQLQVSDINYSTPQQVTFSSRDRIVNWFVTEGEARWYFGPVLGDNGTGFITVNNPPPEDWTQATVNESIIWHTTTNSSSQFIPVLFEEDWEGDFLDESDDVTPGNFTLLFKGDSNDDKIEFTSNYGNLTSSGTVNGDGEFDDYNYLMSSYGTYVVEETQEQGDFLQLWYPPAGEATYAVFLSPMGAQVTTSGSSGGGVVTQQVNKFSVGAAVLDQDVDLATAPANLVVVGGPIVNDIAFELLGNPTEDQISEMFAPGTAMVKLFDLDNGKVAMLVAGWSARDTQAATRKVALLDGTLAGDESQLTVTSLNNVQVSNT